MWTLKNIWYKNAGRRELVERGKERRETSWQGRIGQCRMSDRDDR